MARNQYPGTCYRCGEHVAAGAGHFERHKGVWRVQHAGCAIRYRSTPHIHDPAAEAHAAGMEGVTDDLLMGGE